MPLRDLVSTRARAGAAHFALSAAIALVVFVVIYALWYPWGLFAVAGGRDLFVLIAAVCVVTGPVLTFIVFVHGKKGLGFDLVMIALLQAGALAYGIHVLYVSRPIYLVFVKDRFELVRANDIAPAELAKARGAFAELPKGGPQVVGARVPSDQEEAMRIMFSAMAGVDLQYFPQHYVAYDGVRGEARTRGGTIASLRKLNAASAAEIDSLMETLGRPEQDVRFLPVRAGKRDHTALIDARDGSVLRVVALRPWEFK